MISIKATAVHFLQGHPGYTDMYYRKKPEKIDTHTSIRKKKKKEKKKKHSSGYVLYGTNCKKLRMDFLRNYK